MFPCIRFPLATAVVLQVLAGAALAADVAYFGLTPGQPVVLQGAVVRLQAGAFFNDSTNARLTSSTLAAGGNHSCAVIANGEVRCWGRNGSGQLGNGTIADSAQPVTATIFVTATAVAVGGESSCALQTDGVTKCWGRNAEGQLGNGTTAASSSPVTATGVTATTLAGGFRHFCALQGTGGISCWGANTAGQLGNGTTTGATTAVSVTGISTAVAIAAGGNHSCAVLAAGTVKCWGDDGAGQLGNGAAGASTTPVDVTGISTAVGIAAGFDHSCALLANGTVRCWGRGLEGQLGNGSQTNSTTPVSAVGMQLPIVALGAGANHTCVVLQSGIGVCWGRNANGQVGNGSLAGGNVPLPASVATLAGAIAISGGFEHSCALLVGGDVKCWGLNDGGQLGMGTAGGAVQRSGTPLTVNGATLAINAGGNHTCATTPSGTVSCWGYGFYGQLGNGATSDSSLPVKVLNTDQHVGAAVNVTNVGLGFDHTCGVYADGDAKCWGRNNLVQLGAGIISTELPQAETPRDVYQMSSAMAIASGSAHSCVVLFTGEVQCWGNNNFRQTGYDQPALPSFPVTVPGITTALNVSAGFEHTCAVLTSGIVRCWGRGDEGQLGNGGTANSAAPVTVSGITTATAVSLGNFHSCARLVGGALRCWGRNAEGQLGNGTTTQSSVPVAVSGITTGSSIAAGGFHTCARLSTGEGRCWGRGDLGQLGNGFFVNISSPVVVTGLVGAVNMDAGRSHTCAGLTGGRMQCWGYNELGQLGNGASGTGVNSAIPVTVNGINMDAVGLSYSSSDPAVVTVDNAGNARAVGLGTATITARYDSKRTSTSFTVAIDTDGDTVPDPVDNCTLVPNPGQCDSDTDGFGNHCDGDLNNNDFTNAQDTTLFRAQLGLPSNPPLFNEADINCNGFVNSQDTTLFRQLLGKPPGPAGALNDDPA